MEICLTKILKMDLHRPIDSWLKNIHQKILVCDVCKKKFVTEPILIYLENTLDSNVQFIVEKTLCSSLCLKNTSMENDISN